MEGYSLLSAEEIEHVSAAEEKLKILIGEECVLCGSMCIDAVDTPFDYANEDDWDI